MKYLVIVQSGDGFKNATIFDTLKDAKTHLSEIESALKYPIHTEWENDECLIVKITSSDWIRAYIIKTDRAEYRLVRHVQGEKDEERRFSVRDNAVKHVCQNTKASSLENGLGDWTKNEDAEDLYKLYAVILDSESGSHKVLKRFGAAKSLYLIKDDIDDYAEEEADCEKDENEVKSVKEKGSESILKRISSKVKQKHPKKAYAIAAGILLAIIGIKLLVTDWQLVADERKASQFSASEDVKSIADSLNFTRKGKAVFFATQPKLLASTAFNKTCGRDGSGTFTAGCYYKDLKDDEHIEIYDVGSSTINENGLSYNFGEYRKAVVLHETLHAVWERFSEEKRSSVCNSLRILSNQIDRLKKEVSMYKSDEMCTELFARIGSEYAPILSPENSISSSSIPIKFNALNSDGKDAISNLVKVYDEYYDTKKYSWEINYWQNENKLSAFETKILNYSNSLSSKEEYTRSLINQYYYWPTWNRYYTANNAIEEYNSMVSTYNSYVNTYNKIYTKLDSERTMSSSMYLGL